MQQFRFRFFGKLKIYFFKLQQNISSSKRLTGLVGTLWDIFLYVQRERITMFQLGTYLQSWLFWHVEIHSRAILLYPTCPINNLFASSVCSCCCTQLFNYLICSPLRFWPKEKFQFMNFNPFFRFYDAGLIKMYFEILVFVASLQTLALSATISTSYSEISNDAGALICTSEREVCLPANYSKFQLPNKGKQTVVSIGKNLLQN